MSEEYELFLGIYKTKKINLVNDHRFVIPGTENKVDVRPVSLNQLEQDKAKLALQEIYVFPQPGDFEKSIFLVYYDRNVDINNEAK